MNSSRSATAVWVTQYQVTFSISPMSSATVLPSGTVWLNSGQQPINITPKPGYTFSQWTTNTNSITIENPNAASTTANVNGPGTIFVSLVANPTPTPTPTPSPSPTPTATPTAALTPTVTPTPTESVINSPPTTPKIPEIPGALLIAILLVSIAVILALSKVKHTNST